MKRPSCIPKIKKIGSFREFVLNYEDILETTKAGGRSNNWSYAHTLSLQTEWGIDNSKEILHFENLDEEWRAFCGKYGLDLPPLPHFKKNKSRPVGFAGEYDQEMVDCIYPYLKRDLDALGYEGNPLDVP
jgi:hypothetical protein